MKGEKMKAKKLKPYAVEMADGQNDGFGNSGLDNLGWWNTGSHNTGDGNSGTWNSGKYNSGHQNTGDHNLGDKNAGSHNKGNGNSGDWNVSSGSSGFFNTTTETVMIFNKPSSWTQEDFRSSHAYEILSQMPETDMEAQAWWDSIPETDRNEIRRLPNFDTNIFHECTGITA